MVEVVRTDEFETWLKNLKDTRGKLRIVQRIDRLAAGNPGDVGPVGKGVSELRLNVGPVYRVYYLKTETHWSSCCVAATSRPSGRTSRGHMSSPRSGEPTRRRRRRRASNDDE